MTLTATALGAPLQSSPALAALQTLAGQTPGAGRISSAGSPSDLAQAPSRIDATTVAAGPGLNPAVQSLAQATSAADAGYAAGQDVVSLLGRLRDAATWASQPDLSSTDRSALQSVFQVSAAAVAPSLASAQVGDVNLVDGSTTSPLKVSLGDGATASLSPQDLSLQGLGLDASASLATPDQAAAAATAASNALDAANTALGTLSGQAGALSAHAGVVQAFGQALAAPPTDDGGDGARLLALQIGQQLSASPAAIANAAPQQVLALFRT